MTADAQSARSSSDPAGSESSLHQRSRFKAIMTPSHRPSPDNMGADPHNDPHNTGNDDSDDDDDDEKRWEAYKSGPNTPGLADTAQSLRRSLSFATLQQLARESAKGHSAHTARSSARGNAGASAAPKQYDSSDSSSVMRPRALRQASDEPLRTRHLVRGAAHGLGQLIKPKVWRPSNEPAREPGDWERLIVHVVRGGLRAWLVSLGMRGTIFGLFALIRAARRKPSLTNLVGPLKTYTSLANVRFASMMGAWTLLYKLVFNSLRLLTPPPRETDNVCPRSRAVSDTSQSGLSEPESKVRLKRATKPKHRHRPMYLRDPRSHLWHAYVAGATSALAVLIEDKDMRITLAQQSFVRGMEGAYNVLHGLGLVHIPHGAVWVFGLACAQIMWAWINAPETLPRGYLSWINKASFAPTSATAAQRDITATGVPRPERILCFFPDNKPPLPLRPATSSSPAVFAPVAPNQGNRFGVSPNNVSNIQAILERTQAFHRSVALKLSAATGQAKLPEGTLDPSSLKFDHIPCVYMHPDTDNHLIMPIRRAYRVTKWILPVYLALYFVPALFLRTKSFVRTPLKSTIRSLLGSVRSSLFLGAFVTIFQSVFCGFHQVQTWIKEHPRVHAYTPESVIKILGSPHLSWVAGFMTCFSLFVDDARRRAELAAYVLPKGLESAWSTARKRAWVPFVPGGDLLLTAIGMSFVMGTYARDPAQLSGLTRKIVYQFIGRN